MNTRKQRKLEKLKGNLQYAIDCLADAERNGWIDGSMEFRRLRDGIRIKIAHLQKPEPIEIIGHAKVNIAYVEIDDPMYNSDHHGAKGNRKHSRAAMNMNENIATHWYAKGIIDESEYRAAGRFRSLYERAGGKGAGSIDLSVDRVDGGLMQDPISVSQVEALHELKEIRLILGPGGYDIVERMCGQCQRLKKIASKRRTRDKISVTCQDLLKHIAVHWGYRRNMADRHYA